ncbi:hypothetical protein DB41_FB00210 [Neochlamydia sp. TUME1]|nr:hypothetical protein DB41_FB00210 [Neochlamydia sp. TUME1]
MSIFYLPPRSRYFQPLLTYLKATFYLALSQWIKLYLKHFYNSSYPIFFLSIYNILLILLNHSPAQADLEY